MGSMSGKERDRRGLAIAMILSCLDFFLSSRIIADNSWQISLVWGLAGGALMAAFVEAVRRLSPHEDEGADLADRLDEIGDGIDGLEGDSDPWPIRWFWNTIIAVLGAVFMGTMLIFTNIVTVLIVIGFTVSTPHPWPWGVAITLVTLMGIRLLVGYVEEREKNASEAKV